MSQITNFSDSPLKMTIEAGKRFAYCACGHSDKFPGCDGSHNTYGGKPIKFTLDESQEVILCRCAKSKNLPYCDGSHLD